MKPIIPWIGGKRRLAKYILPLFPAHTCYVEVFCGGGALFFMRQPAEVEVINDINGELVNLYRVVQHHLEEFCRQFKWALLSRQMFRWLQDTDPATLTDIQRAARFYYLQKMSFGAKVAGQTFGTATTTAPKINLLRLEEELSTAHQRSTCCAWKKNSAPRTKDQPAAPGRRTQHRAPKINLLRLEEELSTAHQRSTCCAWKKNSAPRTNAWQVC